MPVSAMAVMASAPVGRRPRRSARTAPQEQPAQAEHRRHATIAGGLGARHLEHVLGVDEDEAVGRARDHGHGEGEAKPR